MSDPESQGGGQVAPVPPDLHELGEIIQAYSAAVVDLQRSHQLLQEQVAQLSGELRRKNEELSTTITQVSSLKNYLASIIDSSADGIVAINREGRVMAWNPAARLLSAIEPGVPDQPEGLPLTKVMTGACQPLADLLIQALDGEKGVTAVEIRLADPGGRQRVLSVSASPVHSLPGEEGEGVTGAVQIFSELTALRELEVRANRHDRLVALGEMAAGVAHEIRNPLGCIELYASSLGRRFPETSNERATCQKIIAASTGLNRIVTDMLTFTRARQPQLRPVQPGQLFRQALDMAALELERRGIVSRIQVEDNRPQELDPDLLVQAILNVVLNAAQAIGEKGEVVLSACFPPAQAGGAGELLLICSDNGPGIPDSAKAKIFDPFFTLRKDGTGLGLAIVHKIIQDHGGSIDVTDNQPRGAVITFRLPSRPVPDTL
ncbi:MAG: PAS domain-containing protein [Planctomycetota bacterium]|nr:PAS domain-containing protein [Planctomycetota bacterium]